jgi:PilZ domain
MPKATRKLVPRDDRVTINHEFASVEEFIAEYVSNISRSGAFIKSRQPLDVGTKVNLRFTVIMDDVETIEGIGEIVRVQTSPPGMGVVFVTLTSHSQDLILKLMTRRRSPGSRSQTLPGIGGERVEPAPRRKTRATLVPPPPPPESLRKKRT